MTFRDATQGGDPGQPGSPRTRTKPPYRGLDIVVAMMAHQQRLDTIAYACMAKGLKTQAASMRLERSHRLGVFSPLKF
jgi:hypothetical protein